MDEPRRWHLGWKHKRGCKAAFDLVMKQSMNAGHRCGVRHSMGIFVPCIGQEMLSLMWLNSMKTIWDPHWFFKSLGFCFPCFPSECAPPRILRKDSEGLGLCSCLAKRCEELVNTNGTNLCSIKSYLCSSVHQVEISHSHGILLIDLFFGMACHGQQLKSSTEISGYMNWCLTMKPLWP